MDSESNKYENPEGMLQDGSLEPLNVPLQYLRSITNNFSDERLLGEGGFGTVYKGVLPNGETVAVKKLNSSMPGVKDRHFDNEARHLMKLKHPNVVLLIGWCSETENIFMEYNGKYIWAEKSERLLCLEYMPNGNLREYLSDEASGLGWDIRYQIIKGICYGLHYLHEEWQHNAPIIHMDLKPANILLDNNMVPKIADFGLSRLFSKTKTWTHTVSRDGTLGYMAPEYIHKGLISTKSDIFSLGVIIIEIVTGHRDYPDGTGISSEEFIELVLKDWRNRLRTSHCYTTQEIDCQQIRECIEIGLVCVTLDRSKRPTTRQIIKMLHRRTNFTDWKEIQTSSLLPVQQNGGLDPLYGNPVLQQMQFQSQQSPPQSVQQGYGQNTGNSGFLQSKLQQQKQEEPPSQQQQQTQQVLHQQSHQEMQQHLSSSCHDIANVVSSMSESAPASQLQSSLLPGSSFYQQNIFEGNGGPGLHLHNRISKFSSQEASNLLNLSRSGQLMASEGWPSKRLAVESLSSLELQSMQQPKLKKAYQSKDRRKKPDGLYRGKKNRDMKPIQDKMVTSVAMANFHTTSTNNVTPFLISMQHPNQQSQAPKEAPDVGIATQCLLEENNQLLNQIAANIVTFKTVENTDLFVYTSRNIKTILSRMSESPGTFMGHMPPLPLSVNEDNLRACLEGFFAVSM